MEKNATVVRPKFHEKTKRILSFIVYNGPTNKKTIENQIRPTIDKPTIYKAVDELQSNGSIVVHHREMGGMVKYYQATPKGARMILYERYTTRKPNGELIFNWIPDQDVLSILSKNPELTPGNEWIETVRSLEPYIRTLFYGRWGVPATFRHGSAILYMRKEDDPSSDLQSDPYMTIEKHALGVLMLSCFQGWATLKMTGAKSYAFDFKKVKSIFESPTMQEKEFLEALSKTQKAVLVPLTGQKAFETLQKAFPGEVVSAGTGDVLEFSSLGEIRQVALSLPGTVSRESGREES